MVGRVLLLIAAFFVAGLGALLVYLYANQADERALAELEPVSVYVVQEQIEVGADIAAAIAEERIALDDVPGSAVPEAAVSAETSLQGEVALTTLLPGEVLVSARIGDLSQQQQFELEDGRIAVSFPFNDPNRVADFVSFGSEVAVFLTWDAVEEDEDTGEDEGAVAAPAAPGSDPRSRNTRLLLDRATVLAVGSTTAQPAPEGEEQQSETVPRTILTLALTQAEAEQLILGQDLGDLYLGLLSEESEVGPSDGADVTNLFSEVGE
jgi:pilus assembly protein CpaB